MGKSRFSNSIRNLVFGIGVQLITFLLNFILRTVFINTLGKEYLGVNGLYGNILTILSLTELGLGTVMLYSLYKPLKENNEYLISQLICYYKKLYTIIAVVMLVIGLSFVPFLDFFVNSDIYIRDLQIYYVLFLLNTVFSYVSIYKTTLINADQKNYIIKNNTLKFYFVKTLIQIAILLVFKNYYIYLFIEVLTTLLTNLYLGKVSDSIYPYLKNKVEDLAIVEKKSIFDNLKSMFLYKFGVVIMNNTDNILISKLVGTVWVGIYSNYGLFINAINTFITTFLNAMFSSIGNLNAEKDTQKTYDIFNMLLLIFHWIAAVCSVCFLFGLDDIVKLWLGTDFSIGNLAIYIIIFNFYLANIVNPVWMYRETVGLFKKIKYVMLIASIINIGLSILLGSKYGIFGIFLATTISRLLTTVWYEPIVLYRDYFHESVNNYFFKQFKYICVTLISVMIISILTKTIGISFVGVLIKMIISFVIVNILYLVLFWNSKEFIMLRNNYLINFIIKIKGVKNE